MGSESVVFRETQLHSLTRCKWFQRAVQDVVFLHKGSNDVETGDERETFFPAYLKQFVQFMPRLVRLRALYLHTGDVDILNERLLQRGFGSVAATLRELNLHLTGGAASRAVFRLWSTIRLLTRLVSLYLDAPYLRPTEDADEGEWDLSVLSALPALETAWVQFPGNEPVCNPVQVEALSQCTTLTHLYFGHWLPKVQRWAPGDPPRTLPLHGGGMVESGLANLMQRRTENGAIPLHEFCLGKSVGIESNAWSILSQCTELVQIVAFWSSTLTPEEWSRLANFQQLLSLIIKGFLVEQNHGQDWHALTCVEHALSALTHCPRLRELTLEGGFDLRTEHVVLLARMPSLRSLHCNELHMIESFQSLASAPALTELSVVDCRDLHDQPITFRQLEMIPPMPHISKLKIDDSSGMHWMSDEEAEPLIVALLQRLPRLTREELHRY